MALQVLSLFRVTGGDYDVLWIVTGRHQACQYIRFLYFAFMVSI